MSDPGYASSRVRLYHGDARLLLPEMDDTGMAPVSVVLTDPPYAAWRYIEEARAARAVSVQEDLLWQKLVFEWATEWWLPLTHRLAPNAVGWMFCNLHYLGFYTRLAALSGWTWRHLFSLDNEEFLLYFGPEPLRPLDQMALANFMPLNTYGQDKPRQLLDALLKVSPPGLVLDPFMGGGHTVLSALAAGREAVGIEIADIAFERALGRVREADR